MESETSAGTSRVATSVTIIYFSHELDLFSITVTSNVCSVNISNSVIVRIFQEEFDSKKLRE